MVGTVRLQKKKKKSCNDLKRKRKFWLMFLPGHSCKKSRLVSGAFSRYQKGLSKTPKTAF